MKVEGPPGGKPRAHRSYVAAVVGLMLALPGVAAAAVPATAGTATWARADVRATHSAAGQLRNM